MVLQHAEITEKIIGAFFVVYRALGYGFLEKVYLVEDKVIVEIKAVKEPVAEHEAQLLNYLRATPYEVGLLLNFGPKSDYRRKVFGNQNKQSATWVEYSFQKSAYIRVYPRPIL